MLDANKAAVLTEAAPNRDFSQWAVDLRSQVSGAAVLSYAWDLTGAPDAASAAGQTTFNLTFTWASFTGAARAESVALTTTFAGGATRTQTFTFLVDATNSPAWSAAPTTAASFPAATTEDVQFGESAVSGATYALGLASGKATTTHPLPAYNLDVPALALAYSSTAAEARPIVRVRYALPAAAATVTAQLTFNGVTSAAVVYDTSLMNPGGVLEFALQADATSLATGRYDYSVAVVGPLAPTGGGGPIGTDAVGGGETDDLGGPVGEGGSTTTTTYAGRMDVVNSAASPFGAGWSLSGVRRLWPVSGGVVVELPGGLSQFRAVPSGGGGGGGLTTSVSYVDGPGDFTDLVLNSDGTSTQTMTDGTVITYSAAGLQTSVVDRDGNTTSYGYDTSNRLTTVTDRHGLVTTLAYTSGKLSSITDPAGRVTGATVTSGKLVTITDADTHAWTYGYDSAARLTGITDPTSRATVLTYGAGGRATSATWGTGATEYLAPQAAVGLAVAPQGTATNPAPAALAAAPAAVHTDARGYATAYRLDWSGFGSTARADAADGGVAVALHDGNDLTYLAADPLGRRSRSFFDASGNATEAVNADDTYSTVTFNGFAEPLVQTDELGHATTFGYNVTGDQTTVTDPLGKVTTRTFNADGTVATSTDPLGHATTYGYDTRGRLTSQTDALGHATTYGYDTKGNKTSVTDALGHATATTYDALNRPLTVTDALSGVTTSAYDAAGRLLTLTDPVGNVTTYAYSTAVDMAATVTDPLSHATTNSYDAEGHLVAVTDRDGRVRQFTFDPVGRPTSEVWRNTVGGAIVSTETMTYDLAGQLVSVADPSSAYAYSYDARGRVHTEDNAGTPGVPHVVLTFSYDGKSDLTSVADSLGGTVGYTYSARTELTGASLTVGGTLGANAAYGYDDAGRQVSVTRREGTGTTTVGTVLAYDNANRLTGITHTSSAAGALSAFAYGYDTANRLTTYTGPDGTLGYGYDATNQLIGVTGSAAESFGYDANGNRNSTGYTVGTGNRLTADGTYTYSYDAEGNRTGKTRVSDGQVTVYSYDQRNRLTDVQVKTSGGVLLHAESYSYDSANRRIGINTDGVQLWTAYRGDNAWADFDSSGTLQTRYLFGLGMDSLIARTSAAGSVGWYLTDNLGSVRQVVTTAGSILYAASYTAYGQVKSASGTGGDRFGYAGREWSSITGEGYYRARQYDPASGRFLSQDPKSFSAGDANLHRYVANSPGSHTDPTGLDTAGTVGGAGAGAGIGAVAGAAGAVLVVGAVALISLTPIGWAGWAVIGAAAVGGAIIGAATGGSAGSNAVGVGAGATAAATDRLTYALPFTFGVLLAVNVYRLVGAPGFRSAIAKWW